MAWNGFGVWALVAQTLTATVFSAVFLISLAGFQSFAFQKNRLIICLVWWEIINFWPVRYGL
jgi:hypothetical protein